MADDALRALERALAAEPGDRVLRERVARERARRGDRAGACAALAIRWEVDPLALPALGWGVRRLSVAEVAALVRDDLGAFDPLALAAAFPRRLDGAWRGNTARFLRRYRAHEAGSSSRRLVLLAWTPGTASLWARPEDRGRAVLTVSLVTRSTYSPRGLLPPEAWRGSAPDA
ncbi:MAG: hypothetical protein KF878_26870 [Planctomycetes bacterium]|nr:hypothetical protein [Planctomycetota bacterium]